MLITRIIKHSLLYRVIAAIAAFFSRQWARSGILGRFLGGARLTGGVFTTLWAKVTSLLRRIFRALRLDKLLVGSIFLRPELWCCLTLFLTPLLPTMAAAGLACAAFFSLFLTHGATDREPLKHPSVKYIVLFACIYAAAVVMSVTPSGSMKHGALHILFALLAVGVSSALRTDKQIVQIIRVFVLSGFVVACYGIYQYVFGTIGSAAWLDSEMFSDLGVRVYSTLDNPNVLSEYLLLVIPFSAALIVYEKKALPRLLFIGTTGAMLLCEMFTSARGGWLGLILAAAVFLVMIDRRFILVGIVGLIALYFVLPDSIINRFMSIGNLKDGSTSYRLSIWLGTLAMIRDFWFVGVGPGAAAFNKIYPIYGYGAAAAQHSHNLFLQLICDAGVAALVIFVMLLFSYVRALASSMKKAADKRMNIFRIAAISSLLGFLVQSATDYSFYNYRVTLVFWMVVGIGMALSRGGVRTVQTGEAHADS